MLKWGCWSEVPRSGVPSRPGPRVSRLLLLPSTSTGVTVPWVPPARCSTGRAGRSSLLIFCCSSISPCRKASGRGGQPGT